MIINDNWKSPCTRTEDSLWNGFVCLLTGNQTTFMWEQTWWCLTPFFQKSSDCEAMDVRAALCLLLWAVLFPAAPHAAPGVSPWAELSCCGLQRSATLGFSLGGMGVTSSPGLTQNWVSASSKREASVISYRDRHIFLDWVYLGQHCSCVILCFLYQNEAYIYFGISSLFQSLSLCLDLPTEYSQTYYLLWIMRAELVSCGCTVLLPSRPEPGNTDLFCGFMSIGGNTNIFLSKFLKGCFFSASTCGQGTLQACMALPIFSVLSLQ